MKKNISLALAVILIVALLCGCGASSATDNAAPMPDIPMAPSAPESSVTGGGYRGEMDYGYAADMPSEPEAPMEDASSSMSTNSSSGLPANVKVIYTARLELETTEFDTTVSEMQNLVASLGGYFENSSVNNYSNYRSGDYTVRVPAGNFEAFKTQVGNLCQLRYTSSSAEDVSEYYYDTESRLITQQTKLARLQDLLSRAESMEDIITIESAISETEYMIEQLTGTLRHYDSLVGYSTVYISLIEVYQLSEVEQPVIGFWAKLGNAFKNGTASFGKSIQRMLINFAYNWIGWVIFLVIAAVVIIFIVKRVKRSKVPFISSKRKNASDDKDDSQN